MNLRESKRLLREAKKRIPGGVNSPVRAYGSVEGTPPFIDRAKGARIWDADGNEYVDYVGSWGPMILGHAHPAVLRAVRTAMARGTSFGAPTESETLLAEAVVRVLPSVQKLRMVSSGTEATMSAIRLARGVTGRSRVLKFDGCYHGHSDGLLRHGWPPQCRSGCARLRWPTQRWASKWASTSTTILVTGCSFFWPQILGRRCCP